MVLVLLGIGLHNQAIFELDGHLADVDAEVDGREGQLEPTADAVFHRSSEDLPIRHVDVAVAIDE